MLEAARPLFATAGFHQVSTGAIVQAAGVSRGALYHQFGGKAALFEQVFEEIEAEVIERISVGVTNSKPANEMEQLRQAVALWLDICVEPDVQQIAILDAPVVLGLARWREIGSRYGLGLAQELLQQAMTANQIAQQPVAPLAQVMLGALREAAFYLREHQAEGVDAETGIRGVLDRIVRTL